MRVVLDLMVHNVTETQGAYCTYALVTYISKVIDKYVCSLGTKLVGDELVEGKYALYLEALKQGVLHLKQLLYNRVLSYDDEVVIPICYSVVYDWFEKGRATEQYKVIFVDLLILLENLGINCELIYIDNSNINYANYISDSIEGTRNYVDYDCKFSVLNLLDSD